MSARVWVVLSGVLACLAAPACTGSSSQPSPEQSAAAGTYTLTAINGVAPPVVTIAQSVCPPGVVDSGSLVMEASGGYTLQLNAHFTCLSSNNNVTAREQGNWTASGSTLTFTGPNALGPTGATLNGRTLSVSMNVTSYGSPSENNGQKVPTTWSK
ncbi:MAG: hypothetical protein ABL982_03075 [Vicinamibacterales bacterium]